MLEKMGWRKGEGLGKDGGGMKTPVRPVFGIFFHSLFLTAGIFTVYLLYPRRCLKWQKCGSKQKHTWLSNVYLCTVLFVFNVFREPLRIFSFIKGRIINVIFWAKGSSVSLVVTNDFLTMPGTKHCRNNHSVTL